MFPLLRRLVLDENGLHRAGSQASIQMSEPEEVMVRGVVVVVVVAVPVAPAPRPHTFGLGKEQECDRKKQGERTERQFIMRGPSTRERLTGDLLYSRRRPPARVAGGPVTAVLRRRPSLRPSFM